MSAVVDQPETFYSTVLERIGDLIAALSEETEDVKLSEKKSSAMEELRGIEQVLHHAIDDLRKNSDWETFTLAFYGETNAGKSTLIECLRILFKESTKLHQREQFSLLQQQLGLSDGNLDQLDQRIETLNSCLSELASQRSASVRQFGQLGVDLNDHASRLRQEIETWKRSSRWISRIVYLFRKLPKELELRQVDTNIQKLPATLNSVIEELNQKRTTVMQDVANAIAQRDAALNGLGQLAAFEDGAIIGDGRSDFTRETQEYAFNFAGQTFKILDVPGIEGDEAKVTDQIGRAVKCAHAVFYVTAKAGPPQTGEAGRQGTLEKIKTHLGAQTEVWSVFNKRITNPIALQKTDLLSDDLQTSIDELDEKMRSQLGDHYQKTYTVSALPAFLAVADSLSPRSTNAVIREKFLRSFGSSELLERTGLAQFFIHLTENLIKDHKGRIRRSNLNKISVVITDVCSTIKKQSREEFSPLAIELDKEAENSGQQLQVSVDALKSHLETRGDQAVESFKSSVLNNLYDQISRNMTNEEFKNSLRETMTTEQKKLQLTLQDQVDKEVRHFNTQVKSIVERYKKHAEALLAGYEALRRTRATENLTLIISIDSGIKVTNLIAAIATTVAVAAAMIATPPGWVVMAVSALTALVSIAKSFGGFFDVEYKKGQQRRSAEANLDSVCEQIRRSLRGSFDEALRSLEDQTSEIRQMLKVPARHARQIAEKFDATHRQLKQLSHTL